MCRQGKEGCSAYCETCDISICPLRVSVKHKSHELSDLHEKIEMIDFNHSGKNWKESLTTWPSNYLLYPRSIRRGRMNLQTEEKWGTHSLIIMWKKFIRNWMAWKERTKRYFRNKIDEMDGKFTQWQKSKDVTEMQKFKLVIQERKIVKGIVQYVSSVPWLQIWWKSYLNLFWIHWKKSRKDNVPVLSEFYVWCCCS